MMTTSGGPDFFAGGGAGAAAGAAGGGAVGAGGGAGIGMAGRLPVGGAGRPVNTRVYSLGPAGGGGGGAWNGERVDGFAACGGGGGGGGWPALRTIFVNSPADRGSGGGDTPGPGAGCAGEAELGAFSRSR
jgi:hypothetical protein